MNVSWNQFLDSIRVTGMGLFCPYSVSLKNESRMQSTIMIMLEIIFLRRWDG